MDDLEFNSAGIVGAGTNVCALANELSSLRRTWNTATTETSGSPFGFAEVEKVFADTQETWSQELGVYVTILEQLCRKLQSSGNIHRDAEQVNLSIVQRH
ncbi:hypothetical protein [Actinomadura sp. DC4]|uniref:hypothetical protein n=1 Tax=Actinomadura sp. DC4 TaxID=3055069 RepID=UPI0025B0479A|nr:hypothetical protein [Actinomadura sp. DC4]MDN3351713.1 hypothetical protein [Actinomadura sp. DC4]